MQITKRKLGLVSAVVLAALLLLVTIYGYPVEEPELAVYSEEQENHALTYYPARRLLTLRTLKTVSVVDGDNSQTITTDAQTVQNVLEELQIKLGIHDRVEPELTEECTDTIKITRVEKKQVVEEVALDYAIEKKEDPHLYKGEQRILEKGKKGLERSVFEIVIENGQEISKNLIEKVVVSKPKTQIVAYGTRQIASRGGQELEFDRVLTMSATAYTHTGNKTYTGIWPSVGIVAVDPKVIPLGTRLYIDGYGYATAMDTGGAIKGNKIDLFFETRAEALKWGRRNVQVFVLK